MPQQSVSIAIRITDHLSGEINQDVHVLGTYDPESACLRYTEPEPVAQVTLTLRENAVTLVRQSEWTTVLEFAKDGSFRVDSDQGTLSGKLDLLTYVRSESSITLEYRLFGPQGELAHTTYTLNFKGHLS
jgi:uncharacterized beta-barrel protein YwiB (DUF1934 family)